MFEAYFINRIQLDFLCSEIQKDQVILWKNHLLEVHMKPGDMKNGESCQEYIDRMQNEDPKLMIVTLQQSYLMVYKKLPTKDQLFDIWFQENRESDELNTEFGDHKLELIQMHEKTPDFRTWASEKFLKLLETNQINIESLDDSVLGQGRR